MAVDYEQRHVSLIDASKIYMSDRITKTRLDDRVRIINNGLRLPVEPYTSNNNGSCQQNAGHIYIQSVYGGYKIEQFCESGSRDVRCGVFSARECWEVLGGIIEGIYLSSKYFDLVKKVDPISPADFK
jgi:hypothetical protein